MMKYNDSIFIFILFATRLNFIKLSYSMIFFYAFVYFFEEKNIFLKSGLKNQKYIEC
jgi:hypothetical protein